MLYKVYVEGRKMRPMNTHELVLFVKGFGLMGIKVSVKVAGETVNIERRGGNCEK